MANTFNIQDTPANIAPSQITGSTAVGRALLALPTPGDSGLITVDAGNNVGVLAGLTDSIDTVATPNLEVEFGLVTAKSA